MRGVLLLSLLALVLAPAPSVRAQQYSEPTTPVPYIAGGFVEEESGLASSRQNEAVLYVHNDNYDTKRVYAVSSKTGQIVRIFDLESLPGINQYSDFEDISVAYCPYQGTSSSPEEEDKKWCIWVGDVGNNAEWGKGTFVYVFEEPELEPSVHDSANVPVVQTVESAIVFRVDYQGYEYMAGPNVEAMTVSNDGSAIYFFHKTMRHGGDGPAGIWQSPDLTMERGAGDVSDRCVRDGNGTWECELADKPSLTLRSHRYQGAELVSQRSLAIRSAGEEEAGGAVTVIPLRVQKLGDLTNPLPQKCRECNSTCKDIRNISGADLSRDGKKLLLATYGGIFIYDVAPPFDMTSVFGASPQEVTRRNRDGSPQTCGGKFWSGQEGIAWDYSVPSSDQYGKGIWSASEHHKKLFFLKHNDA